jgi:hypothetical protein
MPRRWAVDWPAGMTSPPGSAGIPFGRERSDLEAPRAGEERATAPHRVGGAGPQPRPRSRDPSTYPRAPQPPLARRNPFAPSNARSRPAGRSVGPEPRETDQREVAAGRWQGHFRSHRRAEATAGPAQEAVCGERPRELMDGARPQRSRSEPASEDRSGQRPGHGHPDEHGRDRDRLPQERGQPGRELCRRRLGAADERKRGKRDCLDRPLSAPPLSAPTPFRAGLDRPLFAPSNSIKLRIDYKDHTSRSHYPEPSLTTYSVQRVT